MQKAIVIIKLLCLVFVLSSGAVTFAQKTNTTPPANAVKRPRLVVGIVIDQMRWDYLYKYYPLYAANGGFKRFLNNGFSCENTLIPYTPTVTAAGHTCIYTGSVPAIHGIVGNDWYDKLKGKNVYCTEDDTAKGVGTNTDAGNMSPANMLTTTVTDELRIASNFKSKVIGIAIKDRGAILPAGHAANAAYWYDYATGNFITSTYYMSTLPQWVTNFNQRKVVDSLYKLNWNLSLPKETYQQYAGEDKRSYEAKPLGAEQVQFPYTLTGFVGKDYSKIAPTPYGNTLTVAMAKAAIQAEQLGKNSVTDFLTVSFSSPDYIGHSFGPDSWEQMDDYVKLDEQLGNLFAYLDAQVGSGNYTVFLTADHAVAHIPNFSKEHKLPGDAFNGGLVRSNLEKVLQAKFGVAKLIKTENNYQYYLDTKILDSAHINKKELTDFACSFLLTQDGIVNAFANTETAVTTLNSKQKEMVSNGYFPNRSGDIQLILKPGYVSGSGVGTSHGQWNPYDSHIPLIWYGWGINKGSTNRETYMTDIAATVSALLHIQIPSGCVGKVIEEVIKK